jgi:ABC-type transport system involved in multi-copper enzyme maturation permease subunit
MTSLVAEAGIAQRRPAPLVAILIREFRAAILNRYVQVASVLALAGGIAAVMLSEEAGAVAFILLQIALYFVSLFALLAGVSSARAEAEEWPILFAQPAPRWAFVLGKFLALLTLFAGILVFLFIPALITTPTPGLLVGLFALTLGVAAVFGSLGLCTGLLATDRPQGLVFGVAAWLFLLFGYGFGTLLLAQWPLVQKMSDLWVLLLMLNPAEAFRIQALFAFEQIPPESASKTALAQWWLANASAWSAGISAAWTSLLLLLATWRISRGDLG